ncbi:MAG: alpha/beta hydrolase [Rhodospirillales bacterium]
MVKFLLIIVGLYIACAAGLYFFQRHLMYLPHADRPDRAMAGLTDMREVSLQTADGLALLAWYREARANKPTVVFFHGNAGHIGHRGGKARILLDAGLGLLLVEYRGYGGNPGRPGEAGLYQDGRAALSFLAASGLRGRQMVLYGESLGTAVAVRLAGERSESDPIGALVLEAPFTSIADVAAHHYPIFPARYLLKDRFHADRWIGKHAGPLLVLHGLDDNVVPARFGKKLFEAAKEPKEARWIAGAGHNDLLYHGIGREVLGFLRRHFSAGFSAISR